GLAQLPEGTHSMMRMSRRALLRTGTASTLASGMVALSEQGARADDAKPPLPPSFDTLKPLGDRARPITVAEFRERVGRAQRRMHEAKPRFDALYLTPGIGMSYFTGIRWSGGERLFAITIPREGDPFLVCPAFEVGRAREQLRWEMEVRG